VTWIGFEAFRYCSGLTSVTIPNSLTSIVYKLFQDCSSLSSITIPNSITNIGTEAFDRCISLTSVKIPDSVTDIEKYAFYKCTSLTSITIGSGIKSIGSYAFANCPELTDVTCQSESVPSMGTKAFDGSYIEKATLHVPVSAINSYKTTEPWSRFKKIVVITNEPDAVMEITQSDDSDVKYYDLYGRRINQPQHKGLYIRNGKKVVVK
jgi:hypothetical protein